MPVRVGERRLDDAEQIEQADDQDQRRVLEQADEGVDDAGDHDLERLRQDDQAHRLPIAEAERLGGFELALRNRLQAAAHDLRHVGRRKQRDADQRAQQLVEVDPVRQEQRQHDRRHEQDVISGTPRITSMKAMRKRAHDRHLRAPAEREQNAERQRRDDADAGDHERQEQPAPERSLDHRQAERAAMEQVERDDRVDHQQRRGHRDLVAEARQEQRDQAEDQQDERRVDPPALIDRVEAVHELAEARLDEHPARAAPDAVFPRAAREVGIDERPLDERRDGLPQQPAAEQRQDRVERRGEQVLAEPAERPDLAARRGQAGAAFGRPGSCDLGVDVGHGSALHQRHAAVVPVHEARGQKAERQVDRHRDRDDLDRLPGLVEHDTGEHVTKSG